MVFFVLSGYLISVSVMRLWVVLLPTLVLTIFWAQLEISLFGNYGLSFKPDENYNPAVFAGNLFFLQTIYFPQFGYNGPLWSLSYEFWFYLLFPLLVLTFRSPRFSVKVLYAVMFSTLAVLLGERIMQYFLVWLLGYAISFIKPVQVPQKTLRLAITMLAALGAVVSLKYFYNKAHIKYPSFSTNQFIPDLSVGIAFAFLIYVLVSFYNGTGRRKRIQRFNLFRVLAGFSYTMYLTHYPILNFLGAWKGTVKWSSGPSIFIGIIVFVLLYAWVISRFTEGKTNRVRTFMVSHLTHAQPSVTSFKNSA